MSFFAKIIALFKNYNLNVGIGTIITTIILYWFFLLIFWALL
ncbi:MAG: AbgT family transporter [Bacteroidales bacterium]|nr:AbgT family transporter [Bacteroidales bacterium]